MSLSRHNDCDRAIALAGVLEASALVSEAARVGSIHDRDLSRAIATLFSFDANSAEAAMGGLTAIKPALRRLQEQLAKPQDPDVTRYGITLLHHAKILLQRSDLMSPLHSGLQGLEPDQPESPPLDADFLASLAELYSDTVSTIQPRIMVRGDPDELSKSGVAALVRTLLLCGIRAAVLWHQCGGNRWRLLLGRKGLLQACDALIARE